MMPAAEQFADAMGRLGVGDGVRVVLYDRFVNMWAARVWWMLRAFGLGRRGRAERRLEEVDARGAAGGRPTTAFGRPGASSPARARR